MIEGAPVATTMVVTDVVNGVLSVGIVILHMDDATMKIVLLNTVKALVTVGVAASVVAAATVAQTVEATISVQTVEAITSVHLLECSRL